MNKIKRSYKLLIFLVILFLRLTLTANPLDSIKVETHNRNKFVVHKVDKGQGLYAIARRYNVDIKELINNNPDKSDKLSVGEIIRVPILITDSELTEVKRIDSIVGPKNTVNLKLKVTDNKNLKERDIKNNVKIEESHANADSKEIKEIEKNKVHIVAAGETITKIASRYKITSQIIIKWNGLRSSKIEVGQELIVNGQMVNKPFELINTPNSISNQNFSSKNVMSEIDVVEETGFAKGGTDRSVLHRTAPVGTLLLITNIDNSNQCYAKVTGKLTDKNLETILVIDNFLMQKLNATEELVRVNVKYSVQ